MANHSYITHGIKISDFVEDNRALYLSYKQNTVIIVTFGRARWSHIFGKFITDILWIKTFCSMIFVWSSRAMFLLSTSNSDNRVDENNLQCRGFANNKDIMCGITYTLVSKVWCIISFWCYSFRMKCSSGKDLMCVNLLGLMLVFVLGNMLFYFGLHLFSETRLIGVHLSIMILKQVIFSIKLNQIKRTLYIPLGSRARGVRCTLINLYSKE